MIAVIGAKGRYVVAAPFNTLVKASEVYTCRSIRSMEEASMDGVDVYAVHYQPQGLPESTYKQHVQDGITLLALQSDAGHWVYVPSIYVTEYPKTDGVDYASLTIMVALPALPLALDLTNLKASITSVVQDTLGVTCALHVTQTSKAAAVSHDMHLAKSAQRYAAMEQGTDRSRLIQLQNQYSALQVKYAGLEQWVIDHQTP